MVLRKMMTSEEIIKEMASLPAEARSEVEVLITRLKLRYSIRHTAAGAIEDEVFIGMWSDRDDLTDSTAWVRGIRDKHWAN
jgi:hypothetical protein